jgi:hypothetical protein
MQSVASSHSTNQTAINISAVISIQIDLKTHHQRLRKFIAFVVARRERLKEQQRQQQ